VCWVFFKAFANISANNPNIAPIAKNWMRPRVAMPMVFSFTPRRVKSFIVGILMANRIQKNVSSLSVAKIRIERRM